MRKSRGPSYDETLALFTVVSQWSSMRIASSTWDAFCVDKEGLGWATLRPVMLTLRPLFEAAMRVDPTLAVKMPALVTLPGARTSIAMQGVATKARNKEAKAKGEPQTHGKAGKARTRAAEKAALAAQERQEQQQAAAGQGSVTTAPAVVAGPAGGGASPAVSAGRDGRGSGGGQWGHQRSRERGGALASSRR